MLDLPVDQGREAGTQGDRGHQQLAVLALPAVAGEQVEQVGEVRAQIGVGRQQPEVFVQPRGRRSCSCRCRCARTGGCRRPRGARPGRSSRASSGPPCRTPRARQPFPAFARTSMLACSSNRAFSSTRATTCLPASAARTSERMIGLSADVRYRVCLIARTSGSRAACSTKASTEDSRTSRRGDAPGCRRAGSPSKTSGGPSCDCERRRRDRRPGFVLQIGPVEAHEEPQVAEGEESARRRRPGIPRGSSSRIRTSRTSPLIVSSISSRIGVAPRCRRCRTVSIAASRSSASSSSTSTSASRVTRKKWWRQQVHAGEQLVQVRRDHLFERHEALAVGQLDEPRAATAAPSRARTCARPSSGRARRPRRSATGSRCTGTDAPDRPTAA